NTDKGGCSEPLDAEILRRLDRLRLGVGGRVQRRLDPVGKGLEIAAEHGHVDVDADLSFGRGRRLVVGLVAPSVGQIPAPWNDTLWACQKAIPVLLRSSNGWA